MIFPSGNRVYNPSAFAPVGALGQAGDWTSTGQQAAALVTKDNFIKGVFALGLLMLLI